MSQLSLVTGANGHLGNNLVRTLLSKGQRVRVGVRDTQNATMLSGLNCELVYADMMDASAMERALEGVDVLYHVAAVFKHWARNPEQDIVRANVLGTETVMKAASRAGVKKVIYVSSVAAVGHCGRVMTEADWNHEEHNAYYKSKILSEQAAWRLSKEYDLPMVSILPSAMVGPNIDRLTDTMSFIESIRTRSLPVDPNFFFNFVDVRDVAEGAYLASQKGSVGERYILANNSSSSLRDIIAVANKLGGHFGVPPRLPKWLLSIIARIDELRARFTGKPAELVRSQVDLFYGVRQEYDITKARKELGYAPRSTDVALFDALAYLNKREISEPQGEAELHFG